MIELPDGSVFVVDGGGRVPFDPELDDAGRAAVLAESGARVVVPFLKRRGVGVVDVMVLSHPHPDHAGGLRAVVDAVTIKQFWWAGDVVGLKPNGLVAPLIAKVPLVKSTPALMGRYHFGEATVDVLAPAPQERTPTYPTGNPATQRQILGLDGDVAFSVAPNVAWGWKLRVTIFSSAPAPAGGY